MDGDGGVVVVVVGSDEGGGHCLELREALDGGARQLGSKIPKLNGLIMTGSGFITISFFGGARRGRGVEGGFNLARWLLVVL